MGLCGGTTTPHTLLLRCRSVFGNAATHLKTLRAPWRHSAVRTGEREGEEQEQRQGKEEREAARQTSTTASWHHLAMAPVDEPVPGAETCAPGTECRRICILHRSNFGARYALTVKGSFIPISKCPAT